MAQPNRGIHHFNDDNENDPSDNLNDHCFERERYMVYWVEYDQQPPAQRRVHFIFVDSRFVPMTRGHPGSQGMKFQVKGNISMAAMTLRVESCEHPRLSDPTCWFEHIGWVLREDFERRITAVCDTIPPPPRQFNGATRLFPDEPPCTCREWTADVRNQLVGAGILEPLRAVDQGGDPKPMAGI